MNIIQRTHTENILTSRVLAHYGCIHHYLLRTLMNELLFSVRRIQINETKPISSTGDTWVAFRRRKDRFTSFE